MHLLLFNILRQNGRYLSDDIFYFILFIGNLSIYQYYNVCSGNGLAPNRRHAIIWTNDGLVYSRIHDSPGLKWSKCSSAFHETMRDLTYKNI